MSAEMTAHYRDAAAMLRSFAQQDDTTETRGMLLSVAEAYDRLSAGFGSGAPAARQWRRTG